MGQLLVNPARRQYATRKDHDSFKIATPNPVFDILKGKVVAIPIRNPGKTAILFCHIITETSSSCPTSSCKNRNKNDEGEWYDKRSRKGGKR
jgi:hypothetical protein